MAGAVCSLVAVVLPTGNPVVYLPSSLIIHALLCHFGTAIAEYRPNEKDMADFSHYRVFKDHQVSEMLPHEGSEHRGDADDPVAQMAKSLKIDIIKLTEDTIEFDLVGVDAAMANALRRIMLSEVTTVAIETVWFADNTSIIQDEVLAHRIGLIPLKVDPKKLTDVVDGEETDQDTIVLYYNVECTNEKVTKPDGTEGYLNEMAYSGSLTWVPQGDQEKIFPGTRWMASLDGPLRCDAMRCGADCVGYVTLCRRHSPRARRHCAGEA